MTPFYRFHTDTEGTWMTYPNGDTVKLDYSAQEGDVVTMVENRLVHIIRTNEAGIPDIGPLYNCGWDDATVFLAEQFRAQAQEG